jgi:hypothetical protein
MKKFIATTTLLIGFILMAGGNQYAPIIFIPSLLIHLKWELSKLNNTRNIQSVD